MSTAWLTRALVMLLLIPVELLAAPVVNTETLLDDMVDLEKLSRFPTPAYTCKQFSSYDRKAKSPTEDWFANADAANYLRQETIDGRTEWVMMDADGPGAIVRIWSPNPQGTLRVYLDGRKKPAITATMEDLLGGKVAGFPQPIAVQLARGWNSYFPIPYAKHCKVTCDNGKFYYQINYRTYEAGANVETFSVDLLKSLKSKIGDIAAKLAEPRAAVALAGNAIEMPFEAEFGPGEKYELAVPGPGQIVAFVIRVEADDTNQALRDFVLTTTFDDETTGACPVGDFFGSAPGLNPYQSLPVGVDADGQMWSHWVMPFEKYAAFAGQNMGQQPIRIVGHVSYVDRRWTDESMHFHAKWRIQRDIPTRPFKDWNYLTAKGRGVYVGDALYVANPSRSWWGEGDEKIYIDGETFPSHFGTGTEDYYGYGWGTPELFQHAYHNQPRADGPRSYGYVANNRWHIIDAIPFTKDFKFDMEIWHWSEDIRITYAQVSYWYARPGAVDNYPAIQAADLPIPVIPPFKIRKVKGAIEGEEMRVIAKTADLEPQDLGDHYSNEHHLWWQRAKVGDKLILGFQVPQAGKFKIFAQFIKAIDYGIHQLSINGHPAGPPIDFFDTNVIPTGEIDMGIFDLDAGENRLQVECVGTNPKANPKYYMFGLDYIRLEPVR